MNNPKISVIVPVFNVEEYLEDTLNCLVNQSFIDNMEILMIDDGSSDNSRYIIEKYALDYDNFYAFHQENKGISNTRNIGMSLAKGEYIQFLDSDDYISPNCCESLYELAKKNNCDIVSFYRVRLKRYNIQDSYLSVEGYENIGHTLNSVRLNDYPELIWDTFCTNKLYKREFIEKNNLKFRPTKYYEDVPFGLESFMLGDSISIYKDSFYYWRIRENGNLSLTQQYSNIDNFKDRVKMIEFCNEIITAKDADEKIKNELYSRWVDYDLNIYLKLFYLYDEEFHEEIIKDVKDVLKIIPKETIDSLNSTKKILYKMVENDDIEGLIAFSKVLPDLMTNPHIPEDLCEEYKKYIDFEEDGKKEKLNVRISAISNDEENIFIKFTERINYLREDYPHETKAKLISENNEEYPLELNDDLENKEIIIPISLISNKEHMNIKIEYCAEDFKKESLLRNPKRDAIEYDGFDVEMGIEENGIFSMDIRPTSDLTINIENIAFEDDVFTFYGKSNEKIDTAYIENVIVPETIKYEVKSEKTEDHFNISFSIPYEDILSHPVRKWEIKVENDFKAIKVAEKFEFYKEHNKIYIINARNKLLISDDFFNVLETLDEKNRKNIDLNNKIGLLKKENKDIKTENANIQTENKKIKTENKGLEEEKTKLEKENKDIKTENKSIKNENKKLAKEKAKLERENEKLNDKIEEYKSRFVVRYADKINKILKNN